MTFNEARAELSDTLEQIELAITQAHSEAAALGIHPHQLRLPNGGWVLHDLLHSKVQCLHSLVLLDYLERPEHATR